MRARVLLAVLAICVVAAGAGALAAKPRGYSARSVKHGEYLVNALATCGHCHTPRAGDEPDAAREMAGGSEFKGKWGVSYAANLTPDRTTGLGTWTDAQIIRAIRDGVAKDEREMLPPMPYASYHRITDQDVRDIVAYLRSLKPIRNQVAKNQPAPEPSMP